MKLLKTAQGVVLEVHVKPNAKNFRVELNGDDFVVSCREAPIKGKVNQELVKKFSRLFNKQVEIASGFTSRQKKVLIRDIEAEEVNRILVSASNTQ